MFSTLFKSFFNKDSIYTDNVAPFVIDIFKSFKNNPQSWTITRNDNNFPETSKGNVTVDFRRVVDTQSTVSVDICYNKNGSTHSPRLSDDDEKYLIKFLLPLVKDFISGDYDIKQQISKDINS